MLITRPGKDWILACLSMCILAGVLALNAQEAAIVAPADGVAAPADGAVAPADGMVPPRLKYNGAPGTRDLILQDYAEKTGRTLILDPKLPAVNITLKSQTDLTIDEYLEAIERTLRMHGIELVPVGEKFLKVVPAALRPLQEGMKINETMGDGPLPEDGRLVSQMITLKHIDIPEATKAIEPFKHTSGFVHPLERSNSILITDTTDSINRMVTILKHIDQPSEAREVPNVVPIIHAKATDIKTKLEELIKESQAEQKKTTVVQAKPAGQPGFTRATVPGVIRAPATATEPETVSSISEAAELAERGIIRGKVQIVADDRTNILIIITRPENMSFFEKIIKVLDVETAPDVSVKVFRLEYADAESVATMLLELIGAQAKGKAAPPAGTVPGGKRGEAGESAQLSEYVSRREAGVEGGAEGKSKIGELSATNIKILANKRTNALIIMASNSDLETLSVIIGDMDMMLSQVLIEAVILEVGLDDSVQTGIDWVQRAMVAYDDRSVKGGREALFGFAGGGGGGTLTPIDTLSLASASKLATSLPSGHGLTYYFTHFGLNLDVILNMSANDSRTQIVSSPVIVTHDNTEAKISSSKEAYFFKGKRWVSTGTASGTYEDDVESRKIELSLTVTPKINESKLVVMEIAQEIQELGAKQLIGETEWPTINTRSMKASIAVKDRETIVLGGLVKADKSTTNKGIPYLRKIPLFGALFRHDSDSSTRSEIIVFITPYILNTPEEVAIESERRKKALINAGRLWEKGWSDSPLAVPTREQTKDAEKKAEEDRKEAERKAKLEAALKQQADKEALRQAEKDAEAEKRIQKEAEKKAKDGAALEKKAQEDAALEKKALDDAASKKKEQESVEAEQMRAEAEVLARIDARKKAVADQEALKRAEDQKKAEETAVKEAAVERPETKVPDVAPPATETPAVAPKKDPLHDLDPELVDFIKSQEKRFGKKMDKIDEIIEKEMSQ